VQQNFGKSSGEEVIGMNHEVNNLGKVGGVMDGWMGGMDVKVVEMG